MSQDAAILTAFAGHRLIARGPVAEVLRQTKARLDGGEAARIALFDDSTGAAVDVDFRGDADEVIARLADHPVLGAHVTPPKRSGPGRPKLGVVSREVSLLPRHWQWLRSQRGGASVTLRSLVEQARRRDEGPALARAAAGKTHRFMWDMCGDLPDFEEATRALDAADYERFSTCVEAWPTDLRQHLHRLVAAQRELDPA